MVNTKTTTAQAEEAPVAIADIPVPTEAPVEPTNGHGSPALVTLIEVTDIVESRENPRKTFTKIDELAEDIRRRGILQPILVRPRTNGSVRPDQPHYELVFGARRLRAAGAAQLALVPAMIRQMSDKEALELRIIENAQREDVHPLEEAEGYEALHKKHGLTVDEIAAKTGKSKSWVYQRMKLLVLCPAVRQAFYEGRIEASVAVLIARIPTAKLQEDALERVGGGGRWNNPAMSYKNALELIHEHYMLRLDQAPFSRKDPDLVPGAGACLTCPKRTGCQPELFEDVKSADVCTDKECYDRKVLAHSRARAAELKAQGATVLEGKQAKQIFPYENSSPAGAFVKLDSRCWEDSKNRSYRKILKGSDVPITAVINPHSGHLEELINVQDAKSALRKAGVQVLGMRAGSGGASPASKAARIKEQIESRARKIMVEKLVAAADSGTPSTDLWRAIATGVVRGQWHETVKAVAIRRGLVPEKKPKVHYSHDYTDYILNTVPGMDESAARALVVEVLATRESHPGFDSRRGRGHSALSGFLSLYGVDFKECQSQAREEIVKPEKAAKNPKGKAKKAAPKKKSATATVTEQ